MGLRLPRWLRRNPAQQGRHVRGTAPVSVPGAASALVVAATPALLVPVLADAVEPETDVTAAREPAAVVTTADPVVPEPVPAQPAGPVPEPPVQVLTPDLDATRPVPTVALGFADGASVELPADDPRVGSFRAAAAAVLEQPRS